MRRSMLRRLLLLALVALPALAQEDAGVVTPPTLLAEVPARYPADADAGTAAEVTLRLTVDETGAVAAAEAVASSGAPFTREALHAAVQLRFSPALVDGAPRAAVLTFTWRFTPPPVPSAPPPAKVRVRGLVRSRGTRRPVALARVQSDDGAEALTDAEGRFTLEVTPGSRRLDVAAAGFRPGTWREALERTEALDVVYALAPLQVNPFESVVRGERERTEVARVALRDAELREVPGTMGDPFRVVMVLPGVSAALSGLAYPVVRGSGPAATGYFLDGVRVPQLFHAFLGPAVLHPDFIDGLDFFAGGAPVKYGRLTGGVVEGRLTRRTDSTLRATASVDLLNAGGFVEVPFRETDTRVTLAGRGSYAGLLLGAVSPLVTGDPDSRVIAEFWDYQARVEQGLLGGRAQLFLFGASDAFGAETGAPASRSVQRVTFHRADLKHRHPLGPGELEAQFTFGSDLFGFESEEDVSTLQPGGDVAPGTLGRQAAETRITQQTFTTRVGWRAALSPAWSVSAAASWDHLRAGLLQAMTFTPVEGAPRSTRSDAPVAVGTFLAGWAEATFTGVERLALTAGLRADHFHLVPGVDHTAVDPRLSARLQLTERLTLRASAGQYHQPPTFLISLPVVDLAGVRDGLQEVTQTSLGATWTVWRALELSVDAYLNPMARTVELGLFDDEEADVEFPVDEDGAEAFPAGPSKPGRAYGVDLMLRWPMQGRFFGWLTLSVQRSERLARYALFDADDRTVGEARGWLPYAFDQTFVGNLVLSYRFDSGWSVGATLHVNTGRPESGEVFSRTQVPGVDALGRPSWVRVSRDRVDRLPPFARLDLRVAKTWALDSLLLEWWLDLMNATVSTEVAGYEYTFDASGQRLKQATSLPLVVPSVGLKARY